MKKITNISLSGVAFPVENDAYDVLQSYLSKIKEHFESHDDGDEILSDIESGIGEKLKAQIKTPGGVATLVMVESVIDEMGRVEDIIESDEEAFEHTGENKEGQKKSKANKNDSDKRLFRDTGNAILGGVASGIANYFSVDPTFIRLAFVLAVPLNGFGVLAYAILWLIVPEAKTTSEKYQMRGEPVTISKIAEKVQEGVENIRTTDVSGIKKLWVGVRKILNILFTFVGLIARFIFKILRVLIGSVLSLGGILAIAGLTSFFTLMFFVVNPETTDPITRALVAELTGNTYGIVLLITGFIIVLIPLVTIAVGGVSILSKKNRFTSNAGLVLGIGWIITFSVGISTLLVSLPTLSETVRGAERTYLTEGRTWHDIELDGVTEDVLVRGHISLYLVEDDETSLRIFASEDTYKEVRVEEIGHRLEIDRDTHFRLCFFCNTYTPYVVELRAPNVEELEVRGDGDVLVEGIRGDIFNLIGSGSFNLVLQDIDVSDVSVRASGAHNISLGGKSINTKIKISGSSDVFASTFESEDMLIEASGANKIQVNASNSLTGDLSGANKLLYVDNEDLEVDVANVPHSANSIKVIKDNEGEVDQEVLINQIKKRFLEITIKENKDI